MKLNLLERLLILQNLPQKDINSVTIRIVNDLTKELGVTEKDHKTFEIGLQEKPVVEEGTGKPIETKPYLDLLEKAKKMVVGDDDLVKEIDTFLTDNAAKKIVMTPTGGLKWNDKGGKDKEFDIGEVAFKTVKDIFNALNDATPPKLTLEHASIVEKFGIGKGESDAVTEDKPDKAVK